MQSGKGKVHRVGKRCYNCYIPSDVGSDSSFPWSQSGAETVISVVDPGGAVLISREEISREQRQQIQQILNKNETQNHD